MSRPVTLCTGQWADLPLEELAKKTAGWGYDGLEFRGHDGYRSRHVFLIGRGL